MLSGEKLEECAKCDIDEMHEGKSRLSYRDEFNSLYKQYVDIASFRALNFCIE